VGARAKHARWLARVRWVARAKRALGARAKYALGTHEARAFAGFNEHPLVNLIANSFKFEISNFFKLESFQLPFLFGLH
jgi:hypothetical protein